MTISTTQIDFARTLLANCHSVFEVAPPSDMDAETKESLDELRVLTALTIQKLAEPALRLAFIGATSSGKSTLVNALIGKTLVPIDAGEMSAGIAQLFHDDCDFVRLNIAEPSMSNGVDVPEELWEGCNENVTTEEAYAKIKTVMANYHDNKGTYANIIAPKVEARTQLFLAHERERLQLPPTVSLELIDLPGIKSLNDAVNLKVVQETLKQAVLVVVLNYVDAADPTRIDNLLKEVTKVVAAFKCTESIFFVLNKIDCLTKRDRPLPQTLDILRKKLAPVIDKNEDDVVIAPMKSMQLYLYQAGAGFSRTKETPLSLTDDQITMIARGMTKCGVNFGDDDSVPEPEWLFSFQSVSKKIADLDEQIESGFSFYGEELSDDEKASFPEKLTKILARFREEYPHERITEILQTLLPLVWQQSGGTKLLNQLTERIEKHLPRLVIQPAVYDWQQMADKMLNEIRGDATVAIKNTKEELEKLIVQLEQTQKTLEESLRTIKEQLTTSFKTFLDALRKGGSENYSYAGKSVGQDKYIAPFEGVFSLLESIQGNASSEVFGAIRDYLADGLSEDELTAKLRQAGCAAKSVRSFIEKINSVRKIYAVHPNGKIIIPKEQYHGSEMVQLEWYRSTINEANELVTEMLATFFGYNLQARCGELENMMRAVSHEIRTEMFRIVSEECNIETNIAKGLVPASDFGSKETKVEFDMNKLEFPKLVKQIGTEITEWSETRDRTWPEYWAGGVPRYVEVKHTDVYIVLELPTVDNLVADWDRTIATAIEGMCIGISGWFEKNNRVALSFLDHNAKKANNRYKEHCQRKSKVEQIQADETMAKWMAYQDKWNTLQTHEGGYLTDMKELIENGTVK